MNAKWRKPTDTEIKNEWDWEYVRHIQGKNSQWDLWETFDTFKGAVKRAKAVEVSPSLDHRIEYRSSSSTLEDLKDLVSSYQYPRDVDRIVKGYEKGEPIPYPMVLKNGSRMRVLGGNTRMDVAFILHINPVVLMIEPQKMGESMKLMKIMKEDEVSNVINQDDDVQTWNKRFASKHGPGIQIEGEESQGRVFQVGSDFGNVPDANASAKLMQSKIEAPYVGAQVSTLGGKERVTILLVVSLDKKEDWSNHILENSRYMRFHFYNTGVLEEFSGSRFSKKFRKTTVKSVADAIAKINQYIGQVKNEKPMYENMDDQAAGYFQEGDENVDCPACQGTGEAGHEDCQKCGGTGKLTRMAWERLYGNRKTMKMSENSTKLMELIGLTLKLPHTKKKLCQSLNR